MRLHRHLSRVRTLFLVGIVVVAGGADAQAATVSSVGGELTYVGGAGEANRVTVVPWGFSLRVTDVGTGVVLTSGSGCWALSESSAACAIAPVSAALGDGDDSFDASALTMTGVGVAGEAGSDTLLTGGGVDAIDGGGGADSLSAGAGDDLVLARDGAVDTIGCGEGADGVTADADDSADLDCEAVDRPAVAPPPDDGGGTGGGGTDGGETPGGDPGTTGGEPTDGERTGGGGVTTTGGDTTTGNPGGPGGDKTDTTTDAKGGGNPHGGNHPGGGGASAPDPPVTDPKEPGPGPDGIPNPANILPPLVPAQTVAVGASGVATVSIGCPAGSGGCKGTVVLELPPASKARNRADKTSLAAARRRPGRRKQSGTRLGKATFTAAEGTTANVRIKLGAKARRRVARTRARIVVTTRRADGTKTVTTQDVTLSERRRPPRRRSSRSRRR